MTTAELAIPEKALQKHVRAYAETLGWKCYTTWTSIHSPRGWPDLSLWRQCRSGLGIPVPVGELVFIELKAQKGKTTPYQDEWLAALQTVPGVKWCGVIRPSDWYAGVLDEVLR